MVPKTEEQIEIVKEWGNKLNNSNSVRVDSSVSRSKSMTCTYEEGLVWKPLCGCFNIGRVEVCDQQIEEPDDDCVFGPACCHYEPQGCEEDPPTNDGGGSTSDPNSNSCLTGQVEDENGNCIAGEVPCQGNPGKIPRIAEQKQNSGLDGGRFTVGDNAVRDGGDRDHKGLDLLLGHREPLFTMKEGEVEFIGNNYQYGLGKYVIVSYDIGGQDVWVLYAHLNTDNVGSNETVPQGIVIGTAGISGNLAGAIEKNFACEPVHVEVRIGGWSGPAKDPENYMNIKFYTNGNVVPGTDC